jgi:phage shock protein PspC (stress-responsive transcriptional regulator)
MCRGARVGILLGVTATQGSSADKVEDTVKDFWASRPRRPRQGRVLGGVAAGIGRRYNIDPVLVRVVLVVAAVFGGSGVLFYLLGWLFLASDDDEVSAFEGMLNRGHSSVSTGFTVILCLLLIPASSFVWGGHLSTLVGAAIVVAALYLLHRGRGDRGRVVGQQPAGAAMPTAYGPPAGAAPTGPGSVADDGTADTAGADTAAEQPQQPPAWDPLGAAPFAWDLPDPNPPEPTPPPQPAPSRRPRSKATPITLAVALIVASGLVLGNGGHLSGWTTWTHLLGIVTGVLGLGMVIGSFVGGGRGLIGLGVVLSAVGVLATTAHVPQQWNGAGDHDYQPATVAEVQPNYDNTFGDLTVDLSQLPTSSARTVHTSVSDTAGDVTVWVPAGAVVHASCRSTAGDTQCLTQSHSRSRNGTLTATQNGSGPLVIDIDATTVAGDLEVLSR